MPWKEILCKPKLQAAQREKNKPNVAYKHAYKVNISKNLYFGFLFKK